MSSEARPVIVSALTGEGMPDLLQAIEGRLAHHRVSLRLSVSAADGEAVSWLHRHTEVLDKALKGEMLNMLVRVDETRVDEVLRRFPKARRVTHEGRGRA